MSYKNTQKQQIYYAIAVKYIIFSLARIENSQKQ
jgi:hypothetical protein